MTPPKLARYRWTRDPANPVLPPVPGSACDSTCCMNPFVVRMPDEWRLYYAGGDDQGRRRICLATAPLDRPTAFTRRGVVLDLGPAGAFDEHWCVLPSVFRLGGLWHLYYTGRDTSDKGLQSFRGVGLATSADGLRFTRHSPDPIFCGDQIPQFPRNRGVAGGGSILAEDRPDGARRYRMYYTLAVGTPNPDVRIDQEKHGAVCHSADGITWTDHRLILSPRRELANEDIAVAAPFVWRDGPVYRMIYCGIGTRWGYYSMSEAVSADGYAWDRGPDDGNLSLTPGPAGTWESQMVEYPCVVDLGKGTLRLFYCGNGYGNTGIGTATC